MINLSVDRERQTKSAVRFQEREGSQRVLMGTLCMQGEALARLGDHNALLVTIASEPGPQGSVKLWHRWVHG